MRLNATVYMYVDTLEESVVQFLVVNGELPHLGADTFPGLLLERLRILLLVVSLTHLHYTSGLEGREGGGEGGRKAETHFKRLHTHLDKVREVKGRFLNPSLPLQVLPLEAPVSRYGHTVACRLQYHQELGIMCCHIVHLHHVRSFH